MKEIDIVRIIGNINSIKTCMKIIRSSKKDTSKKDVFILQFLLRIGIIIKKYNPKVDLSNFQQKSIKELKSDNCFIFNDVKNPKKYKTSFANINYMTEIFDLKLGKILAFIYNLFLNYSNYTYTKNLKAIFILNALYIDLYNILLCTQKYEYNDIKNQIEKYYKDLMRVTINSEISNEYNENNLYKKIISKSDLDNVKYLFKYGCFISQNEIRYSKFFSKYSKEKIKGLAFTIVNAYIEGFKADNKPTPKNKTVKVFYVLGQEILVREIIYFLEAINLIPVLQKPYKNLNISSMENEGFTKDNINIESIILSDDIFIDQKEIYQKVFHKNKDNIAKCAGPIGIIVFGKKIVNSNIQRNFKLNYSSHQKMILKEKMKFLKELNEIYIPKRNISFTKVALPSIDFGNKFVQLFNKMVDINMLNSNNYLEYQKKIIDVLDKGFMVKIKGQNKNLTNIQISLNREALKNPDKETMFLNGGATLNIPVGELFTTPKLMGTTGILHFREITLNNFKFNDLILDFKNGRVSNYSCKNFSNEEDNKAIIEEFLFLNQEALPMGEFAIGTNTKLYKTAKQYKIMNLLPPLLYEKMGPHFAIGDPCFARNEKNAVYNPIDQKEVVTRSNEITESDIKNKYTNYHIDMTLPYEDIKYIKCIEPNLNEIDIIRDGLFTISGLEQLNMNLLN